MNTEMVLNKIDELSEEYIGVWESFCNIESPTSDKAAVDEASEYILSFARKKGWDITESIQSVSGNAYCITMNADSAEKPVCLSGHVDTVHPKGDFGYPPVKIDREASKIYGPGVVDCKGGIVSALLAMTALSECGYKKRPIKLILQSDEEISSISSDKKTIEFMRDCSLDAVAFLNCEGYSKGKLVIQRKGIIRFVFDIKGVVVHSALCYNGKSAILEAAHKIIELEKWKDRDGITCNCGIISGGTTPNTVSENCSFVADIRYATESELEYVKKRVAEIAETSYIGGTSCSVSVKSERICMEKNERNMNLLKRIREIFAKYGIADVEPGGSNGGSDAAWMSYYGIPTVDSIGTCGGSIHSKNEWAWLGSLADSAKMLASVAMEI